MAGEKKIEKAGHFATVLTSDSVKGVGGPQLVSGKEGLPYDSVSSMTSSWDATHSIKGDQESVGEHGVNYPPTSCYNYYYPGYNGSYTQLDEHHYPSNSHMSDNGSVVYYLSSYNPYALGTLVSQQQCYSSSGYLQPPVLYGSEAMPCYSWDTALSGDISTATNSGFGDLKSGPGGTALSRSSGYMSAKANGNLGSKFSKSFLSTQPIKSLNKSKALKHGSKSRNRIPRSGSAVEKEVQSKELTCGPRSRNKSPLSDSAVEKEVWGSVRLDKYTLRYFQTEIAKFFVIKSDCEDDVHKSIKYGVWTSTRIGNEKLDAEFRAAREKFGEQCPIFLVFSVKGSQQFVGFAEMIGEVDFDKDKDFWQQDDKWRGFFPVCWQVIKDIPNNQFVHITLENKNNTPVTTACDTQEIGMNQGFEMLKIFVGYTAKTSLLDDFIFYEDREDSLRVKRGKPATYDDEATGDNENYIKPTWTDSVKIFWEDVLNNVQQVNEEVTDVLKPVLSKNGIVCELKEDKFELSRAPDAKSVPKLLFRRAVQAITAVTEGVKAELALNILLGEMDMIIIRMKHFDLEEEVWSHRQKEFIFQYEALESDKQLPSALIEHYERSILIVATPPVLLLLGDFITNYIYYRADFKQLADTYVESYEQYKCYPHRLEPFLRPPYKFRADGDDSMEVITGE